MHTFIPLEASNAIEQASSAAPMLRMARDIEGFGLRADDVVILSADPGAAKAGALGIVADRVGDLDYHLLWTKDGTVMVMDDVGNPVVWDGGPVLGYIVAVQRPFRLPHQSDGRRRTASANDAAREAA